MGLEILSGPGAVFLGRDMSKIENFVFHTYIHTYKECERVGGNWSELDGKVSLSQSDLKKTLANLLKSSHLDKVDSAHAFP